MVNGSGDPYVSIAATVLMFFLTVVFATLGGLRAVDGKPLEFEARYMSITSLLAMFAFVAIHMTFDTYHMHPRARPWYNGKATTSFFSLLVLMCATSIVELFDRDDWVPEASWVFAAMSMVTGIMYFSGGALRVRDMYAENRAKLLEGPRPAGAFTISSKRFVLLGATSSGSGDIDSVVDPVAITDPFCPVPEIGPLKTPPQPVPVVQNATQPALSVGSAAFVESAQPEVAEIVHNMRDSMNTAGQQIVVTNSAQSAYMMHLFGVFHMILERIRQNVLPASNTTPPEVANLARDMQVNYFSNPITRFFYPYTMMMFAMSQDARDQLVGFAHLFQNSLPHIDRNMTIDPFVAAMSFIYVKVKQFEPPTIKVVQTRITPVVLLGIAAFIGYIQTRPLAFGQYTTPAPSGPGPTITPASGISILPNDPQGLSLTRRVLKPRGGPAYSTSRALGLGYGKSVLRTAAPSDFHIQFQVAMNALSGSAGVPIQHLTDAHHSALVVKPGTYRDPTMYHYVFIRDPFEVCFSANEFEQARSSHVPTEAVYGVVTDDRSHLCFGLTTRMDMAEDGAMNALRSNTYALHVNGTHTLVTYLTPDTIDSLRQEYQNLVKHNEGPDSTPPTLSFVGEVTGMGVFTMITRIVIQLVGSLRENTAGAGALIVATAAKEALRSVGASFGSFHGTRSGMYT